jgi:hypothetical protein
VSTVEPLVLVLSSSLLEPGVSFASLLFSSLASSSLLFSSSLASPSLLFSSSLVSSSLRRRPLVGPCLQVLLTR